jgi:outer membrane biosynthesis protein TonB
MFPEAKTLQEKSQATGIPLDILQKVYDKGLAAWRTGHRPGATQGQWANARVHSFIMKGCTFYFPDHKLAAEAMQRSQKAKKHWNNVTCICKKGCTYKKNQPRKAKKPKSTPKKSKSTPKKIKNTPQKDKNSPQKSKSTPKKSKNSPQKSKNSPQKSKSTPKKSKSTPGGRRTSPRRRKN